MDIYIKYIGAPTDNYTRKGKIIPHVETRVEVEKYFNIPTQQVSDFLLTLKNDPKIQINIVKSASETVRSQAIEIDKKADEVKQTEIKKSRKVNG